MTDYLNPYNAYQDTAVAKASDVERATFIRRTYAHLLGAILAFVALETLAFTLTSEHTRMQMVRTLMGNRMTWLLVLGGFIFVSWIADRWAKSATSLGMQYAGLGLYVAAEALLFAPMLFLADMFVPGAIGTAAIITLVVFGGLTAFVFSTRSDFSGWGKYLAMAAFGALGAVVLGAIFPTTFTLGPIFSALMIMLAAGYILYDTSNIMHHYNTNQYVAASLALFASVALLFWYVLRIVIELSGRD
ncbi:MAG: US12 family protein [Planctomycetales bacterium]|nr:US12 family protein [Planctomycetales bacterium]